MIIKDETVEVEGLSREGWIMAHRADVIHKDLCSFEVTITSAAEDIPHSVPRSAHHRGDAIDVRDWYLEARRCVDLFVDRMREHGYVVIVENDHIHIHWSPSRNTI